MKTPIDLSPYQPIDLKNSSLAPCGRGKGRGGKKKAAFTLAEVLITLGIIGIVAAMTIPTLISKNQKRVIEAKLKEDYSIIQQVIKSNEGDDVDMSMLLKDEDTNSQKQWFETYFAPYMKYSHVCYNEAGCWQNRGKNRTLDNSIAYNDRQNIGIGLDVVTVKLNNGTNICMDIWGAYSLWNRFGINTSNPGLTFYIDSNGDSGPNVIGKDIYVLTYTSENGILPAGYHKTVEEINNNCSEKATGTTAGTFCLLRAKNNGWIIPDDVWELK
ncbi:MAG: type II secretion system protein [Candidatus Gastranaerophilaceae bacterium]